MVNYQPEFANRLIKHMADGMTFGSFAAELGCHRRTLCKWTESHPEWAEAKEIGEAALEAHMFKLGKRIANGSLVRLAREEPILDSAGKPIFDASGKSVSRRFFAPTNGNATAWIFMMKNLCNWRNEPNGPNVNVNVNQQQNVAVVGAELSDDELADRIRTADKTVELSRKELPDGRIDTVSQSTGGTLPVETRTSGQGSAH